MSEPQNCGAIGYQTHKYHFMKSGYHTQMLRRGGPVRPTSAKSPLTEIGGPDAVRRMLAGMSRKEIVADARARATKPARIVK